MKKTLFAILYFTGGVLLGTLIGEVAGRVSWLSWLCWGKSIGIDQLSVDLAVLQFSFGVNISMNVAMLLCIVAAAILYVKTAPKGQKG